MNRECAITIVVYTSSFGIISPTTISFGCAIFFHKELGTERLNHPIEPQTTELIIIVYGRFANYSEQYLVGNLLHVA